MHTDHNLLDPSGYNRHTCFTYILYMFYQFEYICTSTTNWNSITDWNGYTYEICVFSNVMGYMNLNYYCLSECFYTMHFISIRSAIHLNYYCTSLLFFVLKSCIVYGNQSQSDRILYEVVYGYACSIYPHTIVTSTVRCETKAENEEMNRIQGIMSYLLED